MILETKRLYLRELTHNDFKDSCTLLQDPEVMYAYEHSFSTQEVQEWIDRQLQRYKKDGFGLWAIIEKNTMELIGQCGLTLQAIDKKEVIEIGYLLKKEKWHHGFASEVAIACRDYAFNVLNLPEVYSIIRDSNTSSQRVALRCGMQIRGSLLKHYYNMDMLHIIYSVKKSSLTT